MGDTLIIVASNYRPFLHAVNRIIMGLTYLQRQKTKEREHILTILTSVVK